MLQIITIFGLFSSQALGANIKPLCNSDGSVSTRSIDCDTFAPVESSSILFGWSKTYLLHHFAFITNLWTLDANLNWDNITNTMKNLGPYLPGSPSVFGMVLKFRLLPIIIFKFEQFSLPKLVLIDYTDKVGKSHMKITLRI